MSHTPGPWRVARGKFGCTNVGPATVPHPGRESVSLAEHHGRPDPIIERDANVRLIAAAPDMLAALESVESWMLDCMLNKQQKGLPSRVAYDAVRAAIILATQPEERMSLQNGAITFKPLPTP